MQKDIITIPYIKSEHDQQLIRMKALGIDSEGQIFEQMVNTVIYLLELEEENRKLKFMIENGLDAKDFE